MIALRKFIELETNLLNLVLPDGFIGKKVEFLIIDGDNNSIKPSKEYNLEPYDVNLGDMHYKLSREFLYV